MSTTTKPKTTAAQIRRLAQVEQRERIIFDEREADQDEYDEATGELVRQAAADVPSKSYFDALEAWLDGYDSDVLPEAYPQWVALRDAYEKYKAEGYDTTPTWFMLSEVLFDSCHRNQTAVVLPKSVKELLEDDKMSEVAVARTWKLYDGHGEPNSALVQEEQRNPGSVITPEHKQWWLDTVRRLMRGESVRDKTREAAKPIVKLPGIEDLLKARASVQQVATVMSMRYGSADEPQDDKPWKEVIATIAVLMGVAAPANSRQSLNEGAGQIMANMGVDADGQQLESTGHIAPIGHVDKERALEEKLKPPVDEMASQVLSLFEAGSTAEEIALDLDLTVDRVNSILTAATA